METILRQEVPGNQERTRSRKERVVPAAAAEDKSSAAIRIATLLNRIVFVSLLGLVCLAAVPYGTVEPWWKAFVVCVVFVLWIFASVERVLAPPTKSLELKLALPLFGLVAFAILQTVPFGTRSNNAIQVPTWNAISADPFQTQFFAVQLLAITFAGALFFRYLSSDQRVRVLVNVIVAVAVCSAIFGVVRQTNQHHLGFGLPLLVPGIGYGQFVNANHFALLMEMALGLLIGMILCSATKREGAFIYAAALLIVWTALVLTNSRGGLLAMLAQIIASGLLFTQMVPASKAGSPRFKLLQIFGSRPARIGLLAVLLVGVVIGTLWIGGDRLASRFDNLSGEVSTQARTGGSRNEIWRATWKMFLANPITGVGLGGYWVAITAYHDASGSLTPQEAHNEYLELLSSGGIIGGLLGGWFLFIVGKRIKNNLRSANAFRRGSRYGATLGIIGVLVHSLFDFGLHMLVNALIFAALIAIATRSQGDQSFQRSNV